MVSTVVPYPSITELIPHRGPAVLLAGVTHCEGYEGSFEVDLRPRFAAEDSGSLSSIVGIEVIAQASAALASLLRKEGKSETSAFGYLAAVSEAVFHVSEVISEDALSVVARLVGRHGQLASYEGSVLGSGKVLVSARLAVFEPDGGA